MPLYEYDCPGCGRSFEKRAAMAEADKAVCPHCGGKYPQRRLSRINIKGTNGAKATVTAAPAPGGG